MNWTEGRLFVLRELSSGNKTPREISNIAREYNLNRRFECVNEWADGYLRWLRDQGFAEKTGRRSFAAAIHAITPEGVKALDANS